MKVDSTFPPDQHLFNSNGLEFKRDVNIWSSLIQKVSFKDVLADPSAVAQAPQSHVEYLQSPVNDWPLLWQH